jgi:hypothetical protein
MGAYMRRLLAVAIFLSSCATLNAQPSELIIVGIGARPCADTLKTYREGPKAMSYLILTWAHGFWSSQNAMFLQARVPMLKNLAGDDDTQVKALMAACERKPSQDFGLIVRDYYYELPSMQNPQAK